MTIIKNSAQCTHCGDILVSTHRHHWVSCTCWDDPTCHDDITRKHGIFVDGGNVYLRFGFANRDEFIDLSIETPE